MDNAIEQQTWEPANLLSSDRPVHEKFALVVLNQALRLPPDVYNAVFANAVYKVAADGGANRLYSLSTSSPSFKLDVDAVIGDLDSLRPEARKFWENKDVPIIHDPDQNSTDFTKAVKLIKSSSDRSNIDIVILGGLGGRVDQGLSVLHHLYLFQTERNSSSGKMYLLSSEAITFVLTTGEHIINVKAAGLGKHIGIVPMKELSVISTKGLVWDVDDWETEFGGQMSTSNLVKEEWVWVKTSKDVLFTIDLDVGADDADGDISK